MIDLTRTLQNYDLGYLRILAGFWGIDLQPSEDEEKVQKSAALQLVQAMTDPVNVREIVETLPKEAHKAIDDLVKNGGVLPWSLFTRRYGELREMGAARRDRELPYRNPISPAEILWYRGIIARAFQDTPSGLQEYAYIPADLLPLIPPSTSISASPLGRKAIPKEYASVLHVRDRVLDHACTLLAALRMGIAFESQEFSNAAWMNGAPYSPPPATLLALLSAAGLIDPHTALPHPEPARHFLELPRGQALAHLVQAWLTSQTFNELRLLPGLRVEGSWQNDPLRARDTILQLLSPIPRGTWWSLNAFVDAVRQSHPDFQRPAGDYDSWYLYDTSTQAYLRGVEHWDEVDGALIRYLITGPMHWLGLLDLSSPDPKKPPSAFRFSAWADPLLAGASPEGFPEEKDNLLISSDGKMRLPVRVPRAVRYQVARFSRWEKATERDYTYRITDASLKRARQQGLSVSHLLSLLRRHALTVPPSLAKALERWENNGSEAKIEQALILRLRTPDMLRELRASPVARYLGDPLGPTVVIVKAGAWEKLMGALAEMGYLAEGDFTGTQPRA